MVRMTVHITRECKDVDEAKKSYNTVKAKLNPMNDIHVNGQVTVKFEPSHPDGTPEEGPKP